jgi:putative ABC transport system ATP-binding protein
MIKLENLSKVFISGEIQTTALSKISLNINKGEYVAITGPSGCGKSTLLSILGMLDVPNTGKYHFEDSEISNWTESKLNNLRKGKVGFIFQNFNLIEELSVFENVALALDSSNLSSKEKKQKVNNMLEQLGISHRASHRPYQLSGGQQQRVAIARALVATPRILLADEPTGNLDTAHGDEVMQLLKEINEQGTTVVMVTHSKEHAKQASRSIHLLDGQIKEDRVH